MDICTPIRSRLATGRTLHLARWPAMTNWKGIDLDGHDGMNTDDWLKDKAILRTIGRKLHFLGIFPSKSSEKGTLPCGNRKVTITSLSLEWRRKSAKIQMAISSSSPHHIFLILFFPVVGFALFYPPNTCNLALIMGSSSFIVLNWILCMTRSKSDPLLVRSETFQTQT